MSLITLQKERIWLLGRNSVIWNRHAAGTIHDRKATKSANRRYRGTLQIYAKGGAIIDAVKEMGFHNSLDQGQPYCPSCIRIASAKTTLRLHNSHTDGNHRRGIGLVTELHPLLCDIRYLLPKSIVSAAAFIASAVC